MNKRKLVRMMLFKTENSPFNNTDEKDNKMSDLDEVKILKYDKLYDLLDCLNGKKDAFKLTLPDEDGKTEYIDIVED